MARRHEFHSESCWWAEGDPQCPPPLVDRASRHAAFTVGNRAVRLTLRSRPPSSSRRRTRSPTPARCAITSRGGRSAKNTAATATPPSGPPNESSRSSRVRRTASSSRAGWRRSPPRFSPCCAPGITSSSRPTATVARVEFVRHALGRFGITSTLVPPDDFEAIRDAIVPGATNPPRRVSDQPLPPRRRHRAPGGDPRRVPRPQTADRRDLRHAHQSKAARARRRSRPALVHEVPGRAQRCARRRRHRRRGYRLGAPRFPWSAGRRPRSSRRLSSSPRDEDARAARRATESQRLDHRALARTATADRACPLPRAGEPPRPRRRARADERIRRRDLVPRARRRRRYVPVHRRLPHLHPGRVPRRRRDARSSSRRSCATTS